ncbi:hypothetical protein JKG68_28930 [Microvirga aerilata]|uniref:Uncharacterized protein n=1 Tax=Microvirga aerilata TaxID=670292 RepID=A0A937D3K9_9HYPH|nr:hypothetical protein [Microvirga aerilata]
MRRFVEGVNRSQTTLFPESLDDWVDENNPVRAIDAFVDALDLRALGFSGVDLARTVRLKWPWIRTVLTSGAPLEDDFDKALRHVRFMPKPWRALEVLMEAEKAADASQYETIVSRTGIGVVRALRA